MPIDAPAEVCALSTNCIKKGDSTLICEFNAGDVGFEEITISNWSPGLYIAKLLVNGQTFDTVKISVVK